ncbi:NAD(P)H azoreductase [Neobacillus rhizosphaerae]|uniref:NAD(P)H azoreductase n=1 Tax=Neobacillus rhizosphaerae TaxID=2880965 RepID=A0ABN8KI59_9BACI|nr:NmrA family NAD(P)-binding protein [Neobacillus rhizosphaerae]CAH2713111.1 NAD(P)H azoreductase [Neobacillus rhizosphaerae]
MNILVIGGTGTVGSQVVLELLSRKASVRILTRNPSKNQHKYMNSEWIKGDLEVPESLEGNFDQLDAVFLLTGMSQTETIQGVTAVKAARKAGVPKIVYLSAPMNESMLHIPHIKSKIGIEEEIKRSGMDYTILRPNNFFQNDYVFRDAILKDGIYPQPLGSVGLNRIDVVDIAYAAANALLLNGYEEKEYPIYGSEVLTGDGIAETYSRHTGTPVRYIGDDLDAWYQLAITMMPQWLAQDFCVMYKSFQSFGCLGTDQDFILQKELLLREPKSFEAFVAETVTRWKNE